MRSSRAWPRAPACRRMPGRSIIRRNLNAAGGGASGRRRAFRPAVGDLRAEAAAGVPACQAGLRGGADRDRGMRYSIVRPTAFFKSLSGQVERVRRGKPFLIFGDGRLTACKPISDARPCRLSGRLRRGSRRCGTAVLPIGGPGEAITPREQGEALFALLGRAPKFQSVPVGMLDVIVGAARRRRPVKAEKAELARIGRYYATESDAACSTRTPAATTPPPRLPPGATHCSIIIAICCPGPQPRNAAIMRVF